MKCMLPVSILLALSITARAQDATVGSQVTVHVQILELSLTKLQRLGIDLAKLVGDPNAKPDAAANHGANFAYRCVDDGKRTHLLLEILHKRNLNRSVVDTKLVTTSGKTVVCNAGDELSVPKPQHDGSVPSECQHGTQLKLTPDVLDDRNVRLTIHCQLAGPAPEDTVSAGKERVPGIHKTELTTRADLQSGQTLMLAGPTEVRVEAYAEGVPWLSEIPYVGAVFRKIKEERNDFGIIVLVRPELLPPATVRRPADAQSFN
jgi:pilus assembly protein CpaC